MSHSINEHGKQGTHKGNETRRASGTAAPQYTGVRETVADLPQNGDLGNEVSNNHTQPWNKTGGSGGGISHEDHPLTQSGSPDKKMWPKPQQQKGQI